MGFSQGGVHRLRPRAPRPGPLRGRRRALVLAARGPRRRDPRPARPRELPGAGGARHARPDDPGDARPGVPRAPDPSAASPSPTASTRWSTASPPRRCATSSGGSSRRCCRRSCSGPRRGAAGAGGRRPSAAAVGWGVCAQVRRGVAQRPEPDLWGIRVVGSNPTSPTTASDSFGARDPALASSSASGGAEGPGAPCDARGLRDRSSLSLRAVGWSPRPSEPPCRVIPRFGAYAAAFEKAYAGDEWSLVEPFFAEDAVYDAGLPELLGGRIEGRAAILAYFRDVLNRFDRRFASRRVELLEGPRESRRARCGSRAAPSTPRGRAGSRVRAGGDRPLRGRPHPAARGLYAPEERAKRARGLRGDARRRASGSTRAEAPAPGALPASDAPLVSRVARA